MILKQLGIYTSFTNIQKDMSIKIRISYLGIWICDWDFLDTIAFT